MATAETLQPQTQYHPKRNALIMGLVIGFIAFGMMFYMMYALAQGQSLEGKAFATPCSSNQAFQKTCYVEGKVTSASNNGSANYESAVSVSAPSVSKSSYSFVISQGLSLPKLGQSVKIIYTSPNIPWLEVSALEIDAQNPGAIGYTISWLPIIGFPLLIALFFASLMYFPFVGQAKRFEKYEAAKKQTEAELVNSLQMAPVKTAFTHSKTEELAQVLSSARSGLEKVWIDSEHMENGEQIADEAYILREDVLELEKKLHDLRVAQGVS